MCAPLGAVPVWKSKEMQTRLAYSGYGRVSRGFLLLVFYLFDVLACSANDIINDFPRHRLWADGPDSPALVQQSVKLLGSLQHGLLRVTS